MCLDRFYADSKDLVRPGGGRYTSLDVIYSQACHYWICLHWLIKVGWLICIYLFVSKSHEISSVIFTVCIAQVVMCHVLSNNIVSSSRWKIGQISEILTILTVEGEIKINSNNEAYLEQSQGLIWGSAQPATVPGRRIWLSDFCYHFLLWQSDSSVPLLLLLLHCN